MKAKNIWNGLYLCSRVWRKLVIVPLEKKMMGACGKNVTIERGVSMNWEQVFCGDNVYIGREAVFMCTRAPIKIGNDVMFGPRVTMITGDHRTDVIGKKMMEVSDQEKQIENDQPIVLEGDNWIGANVTILKGVTIEKGAVIAAGAVVNKDIPAYTIAGGVPARVINKRFSSEQLQKHKEIMQGR